jgi:hypothetical protein
MWNVYSIYKTVLFALLTVFVFSVTPVFAQVTFTTNQAQFIADNPGLNVQNFDSGFALPGGANSCDTPLDSNNSADCFPPGAILPGIVFDDHVLDEYLDLFGVNYNGSGNPSKAIGLDNSPESLDIIFRKSGVAAVGIRPGCFEFGAAVCQGTLPISVFDAEDNLIGSTQIDVSNQFDDFLGIESSSSPIARINIGEPESGHPAIDEVSFGGIISNIPTLSGWGLTGMAGFLGLAGFIIIRRRKAAA